MTLALITAVFDGYDTLKALPQLESAVHCVCVTDDDELAAPGWEIVVQSRGYQHPNRAAKRPKMLPWEYTDADYVLWIDASFRVGRSDLLRMYCDLVDDDGPIAQYAHPLRDCIYDEGAASIGIPKYDGEPIDAQLQSYRDERDHPPHWGLWATGIIVRKRSAAVEDFGRDWLHECQTWSFQDQLSEAVVLREHELRPREIAGHVAFPEPFMTYEASGRHHGG